MIISYKGYSPPKCSYNDQTNPYTFKRKCLCECCMSCMECLHAHIPSHSPTPSHMPMPSVTIVTGSTNDTNIPSPYRLPNTQFKCQWATNPESIPTPTTQLEVNVVIVCLILGNGFFRITPRISYTHRTFRITQRVSYTHVPSFSHEGINDPLLALPNTH